MGSVIIHARSQRVRDDARDLAYGRTAVVSSPVRRAAGADVLVAGWLAMLELPPWNPRSR
ncbi:hypothetical protein Xph01_45070 [Micromonospora phaseoli]|nr:hypothetical protein Xph01_45070 [Micromonospora phaseoli]